MQAQVPGGAAVVQRLLQADLVGPLENVLSALAGERLRVRFGAAGGTIEEPPAPAVEPEQRQVRRERQVLGRPISGVPKPLQDISLEDGRVVVEAEVITIDERPRRGGGKILTLSMSDHVDGLVAKVLLGPEDRLQTELQSGMWLRLKGNIGSDERQGEPILWARDISTLERDVRRETCPTPRAELHLHTRMSQMDAVLDLERLIETAERFAMPAVAITDHGVLQAYPEAQELARRSRTRVLYGLEAYVVEDDPLLVMRPDESPLQGDFVAVDLETSSLSPRSGEIIEVALVRFKGGEPQEEFASFVRPKGEVSKQSYEITGIDEKDLTGAPLFEELAQRVHSFIGGLPLIGHNAAFDEGFLRMQLSEHGLDLTSPVIDTLGLSRTFLSHMRSHRLPDLQKELDLPSFTHHRAGADARTAGLAALRMLGMAAGQGARTLRDVQEMGRQMPLQHRRPYHVMLLVQSQDGLRALYRMVTEAHLRQFHRVPRLYESQIASLREAGVLLGAAGCLQGEILRAWLRGEADGGLSSLLRRYDYVELHPKTAGFVSLQGDGYLRDIGQLEEFQGLVLRLAREASIPVAATGDVHYLEPEEQDLRRIVLRGSGAPARSEADRPVHLRTAAEMLREFQHLGADAAEEIVLRAPLEIVARCGEVHPVPDELSAPDLPDAAEIVEREATQRLHALYGDDATALARLERELGAILGNGFGSIYRIAQLLTQRSLADGYLVGSRGSVGSSFVAYLTGITEVNPLPPHWNCPNCHWVEYAPEAGSGFDLPQRSCPTCGQNARRDGQDIPFETFLGFDGDKVPDIDLNFSGEYQAQIHRYAEEILGGQVYRAGTIATVAERTAYGLVKGWSEERGRTPRGPELDRLARGVTGVKRTTGQHPGGVMVVPETDDVFRFTPLQRPADDPKSEVVTTHFDYHSIASRLLKLDLLGHDDPTVLRLLEKMTGIAALSVPCDDHAALSLFSGCEALGVGAEELGTSVGSIGLPEFGTRFVRQMLEATRPKTFAELVRISGLSHGTDVWTRNADELIRSGRATLREVIATRDDIMLNLIQYGLPPKVAFQITEQVRKGKGLKSEDESQMRARGVPDWYIDSCQKIQYMFPKAHAAAYVIMAVRIAYFKVHHPAAFYATYLSVRAEEFDASLTGLDAAAIQQRREQLEAPRDATARDRSLATILEVVREMLLRGVNFARLDLERSDERIFQVQADGSILPPLLSLPGLGPSGARQMAQARQQKPYSSIADLRGRGRAPRPVIDTLRELGCLAGLPETDQMTLF